MSDRDLALKIIAAVRPLLPRDFVGKIELNCSHGTISNVNIHQSFKEEVDRRR